MIPDEYSNFKKKQAGGGPWGERIAPWAHLPAVLLKRH